MNKIIDGIIKGIVASTWEERSAVFFSLAYVILLANKKRIAWCFAFGSACLYTFISFCSQLYLESALQLVYIYFAIAGWFYWKMKVGEELHIRDYRAKRHFQLVFLGIVFSLILGYFMKNYSSQHWAYLNAFTCVFSLMATYLSTRIILSNWLYWIVIDIALIVLYGSQSFFLTGFLYLIYTIVASVAYFSWKKSKAAL